MTLEGLSRDTFDTWRTPRFGSENPTRFDSPLWAALAREDERSNAWKIGKHFGYERAYGDGPTWCFDRFGQSTTVLADGRTLYIGGEHEDYYDPDFYIYNDVVVAGPDGGVELYGYPREAFPPTDFHSATLAGDHVWIAGSLGYADARRPGSTQVCRLDLRTLAIETLVTTGAAPGWIHKHAARLDSGELVLHGGLLETAASSALHENIDEWSLDLGSLVWTRRTALDWQRFAFCRSDDGRSYIWELRQMKWQADHPQFAFASASDSVKNELGEPDLGLLASLYTCDGATALVGEDDEFNRFRIELDGVIVRFTEEPRRVVAIVEGRLAEPRLRALQDHVQARLAALHGRPWQLEG